MAYQRESLGQDDDFSWQPFEFEPLPSLAPEQLSTTISVPSIPSSSIQVQEPGIWTSIWGGVKDVLVPLSTAAANIITATKGIPVRPGTAVYNPRTGTYQVPTQQAGMFPTAPAWLFPALLGGGLILLLRRRK